MREGYFDFGIVGLGTMGRSLLLNMVDHGIKVAGLDNNPEKLESLKADVAALRPGPPSPTPPSYSGTNPPEQEGGEYFQGFTDSGEFLKSIRKPRPILVLVPAGDPVDAVIAGLRPLMEPGDHLIDGGNSFYKDTDRRAKELSQAGLGFVGMGVSGGESGARHGPSMMPGGTQENWDRIKPILEAVAAKYDGEPCVALMGSGSAGHYVKTVHNGIEYAIMQLIAETYDFFKRGFGMDNAQIAQIFGGWNQGQLQGFLIEITEVVLNYKDPKTGGSLVDLISDKAKSKGTGKWTSQDAMDLGLPVPTIDAAVNAREISGYKPEREEAEKLYAAPGRKPEITKEDLESGLYAGVLLCYAQGMAQIKAASDEYGYGTNLEQVAKVWRAGCIIRSRSLEPIRQAFARKPDLANLLLDAEYGKMLQPHIDALRKVVIESACTGIPAPAHAASLAYFDSYRTGRLPANLIQAQRDLFGAHTYERLDEPGVFHTQWQPA